MSALYNIRESVREGTSVVKKAHGIMFSHMHTEVPDIIFKLNADYSVLSKCIHLVRMNEERHVSAIRRTLVPTNSPTSANLCIAKFGRRCARHTRNRMTCVLCIRLQKDFMLQSSTALM